jgi:hypothetical protein
VAGKYWFLPAAEGGLFKKPFALSKKETFTVSEKRQACKFEMKEVLFCHYRAKTEWQPVGAGVCNHLCLVVGHWTPLPVAL